MLDFPLENQVQEGRSLISIVLCCIPSNGYIIAQDIFVEINWINCNLILDIYIFFPFLTNKFMEGSQRPGCLFIPAKAVAQFCTDDRRSTKIYGMNTLKHRCVMRLTSQNSLQVNKQGISCLSAHTLQSSFICINSFNHFAKTLGVLGLPKEMNSQL